MSWMLISALAWAFASLPLAVAIGRGLRTMDHREAASRRIGTVPDYIPAEVLASVNVARRGS